uniref:Transposase n=1 Tax=Romanomermis culicivorax TaxID=13658 RepID=A0A915IGW9_ROMCU
MSVNHSLNFKDPKSGVHTNGIESSWRPAKSSMSSAGRVKHHIAGNLARYMFNRRCRELKMDATLEFFRLTGQLYNATSPS